VHAGETGSGVVTATGETGVTIRLWDIYIDCLVVSANKKQEKHYIMSYSNLFKQSPNIGTSNTWVNKSIRLLQSITVT
jgi:hypothetical protein